MRTHEPYYLTRLRELREAGLAKPRERIYVPPVPSYAHLVQRLARRFQRELAHWRVMDVYWVPSEETISIRRLNAVQPRELPKGAIFMGRYRYPHATLRLVDDLTTLITKGEA